MSNPVSVLYTGVVHPFFWNFWRLKLFIKNQNQPAQLVTLNSSLGFFKKVFLKTNQCAYYLTVVPRARTDYWLRRHEGERNNYFSNIQLVGQKYRDKTTLGSKTRFSPHGFGFTDLAKNLAVTKISYWLFKVLSLIILQQAEGLTSVNKDDRVNSSVKFSYCVYFLLRIREKLKSNLVVLVVHYLI